MTPLLSHFIEHAYRYNQVASPTFVIFFMHEPFVVTVDPENVKVKLPPYVNLHVYRCVHSQ